MAKKTKFWFTKVTEEEKEVTSDMVKKTGADSESSYIRNAVREKIKRDKRSAGQ